VCFFVVSFVSEQVLCKGAIPASRLVSVATWLSAAIDAFVWFSCQKNQRSTALGLMILVMTSQWR